VTVDYDFSDPRRIDRILRLVGDGWRRYPNFRLGQFLEIVSGDIPGRFATSRLRCSGVDDGSC
jgi:hypothetical protein